MANYIKDVYDVGKKSTTRTSRVTDRNKNATEPVSPYKSAAKTDKLIEDHMDKKIIMAANTSPNSNNTKSIREKVEQIKKQGNATVRMKLPLHPQ